MTVNIVTLKWGSLYGPEYVNRLKVGISRNFNRSFRFLCFTDDVRGIDESIETFPLPNLNVPKRLYPSQWLKIFLLEDGLGDMEGDCLFLDLDLIITGSLDCFFDYMPEKRCIIHNWLQKQQVFKRRPNIGNSSVFRWRANTTQIIVDKFHSEVDWAISNFRTEQEYLTYGFGEKYWWPEPWVRSFKRHSVPNFPLNLFLKPKLPPDTRILVFHGRPNPDEAIPGWTKGALHRRTRPTNWITDYWNDSLK